MTIKQIALAIEDIENETEDNPAPIAASVRDLARLVRKLCEHLEAGRVTDGAAPGKERLRNVRLP